MMIDEIKRLKETEHKVEFKEAANQYNYQNGRNCLLGYIVALANEGGGKLIFGVRENKHGLHHIIGSKAWLGREGKLEGDVYRDLRVRINTEVLSDGTARVLVIHVPKRPIGSALKWNDVPLMRSGDFFFVLSKVVFLQPVTVNGFDNLAQEF